MTESERATELHKTIEKLREENVEHRINQEKLTCQVVKNGLLPFQVFHKTALDSRSVPNRQIVDSFDEFNLTLISTLIHAYLLFNYQIMYTFIIAIKRD